MAPKGNESVSASPPPAAQEMARQMTLFRHVQDYSPDLYDTCEALRDIDARRLGGAISPLIAGVRAYGSRAEASEFIASSLAQTLIYVAFGRSPIHLSDSTADLDAMQREALLLAIVESDTFWRISKRMMPLAQQFKLLPDRESLRSILQA
jgi:hypothetical protein